MQKTETQKSNDLKGILFELGIPAHKVGYRYLLNAVPQFAANNQQMLCAELYPCIAEQLNCTDGRAVEHAIRTTIRYAWKKGSQTAWAKYFPSCKRPPTNKRFIATIAEYLKK